MWLRKSPFKLRKIDFFFLISDYLQENTESVEIIPLVRTDHYYLLMKLRLTYQGSIGRSYWRISLIALSVSAQRVHQGPGMFSSIMAASVFLQIVSICLVFKRLSSLPYMEVVNSNFRRIFCST